MKYSRHFVRRAVKAIAIPAIALTVAATAGCGAGEKTAASATVDEQGLEQARTTVSEFSTRPTELNVTEPVGQPVPTGKVVDFVSCGAADCSTIAGILTASVATLGWTLNVINTDGSPESQQKAFAQVVRDRADGVIYIAIDRTVYEQFLPQLQANGTWMVSACSNDDVGNGIDYAICTPDQQKGAGELMAASIIADSAGTARSVYFNVPAFTNLNRMQEEYLNTIDELCPACTADHQDIPNTALGNGVPSLVVGYLRANPDVTHIALSIDSLAYGLPAALDAAGIDVTIVGEGGGNTTWQYIKTGDQAVSVPSPFVETYLAGLDSIVRHVTGVPQVESKLARFWIVTADNVDETDDKVGDASPVVGGSDRMFQQLWGVA